MVLKKLIGDRAFYRRVFAISIPIIIQNAITNFVNLLDNVMVGALGTEAMSGVSIVNQFVFIFNLLLFGAMSAAGIFTAQYHGKGDVQGVRNTFRLKMLMSAFVGILGVVLFVALDDQLISTFLHDGESTGNLQLTLQYGKEYLAVFVIGMIPFAISQAYASTLRETGDTVIPMYSSVIALVCNCGLNYIFIFVCDLGVTGAAIATVISRCAELAFVVIVAHARPARYKFIRGAYRSLALPRKLITNVLVRGMPLIFNEFMWAISVTLRNQSYSMRGLDVVAAINITSVIVNLASVVYMACGASISIIVGAELGAGNIEKARDSAWKMLAFSVMCAVVTGAFMTVIAPIFPRMYETSDAVRELATYMTIVSAIYLPFDAFSNAAYFTIRSGGRVFITFLLDSGFMWAIVVPLSLCVAHLTNMNILYFYLLCQGATMLKPILGFYLLRRGTWARQLVAD